MAAMEASRIAVLTRLCIKTDPPENNASEELDDMSDGEVQKVIDRDVIKRLTDKYLDDECIKKIFPEDINELDLPENRKSLHKESVDDLEKLDLDKIKDKMNPSDFHEDHIEKDLDRDVNRELPDEIIMWAPQYPVQGINDGDELDDSSLLNASLIYSTGQDNDSLSGSIGKKSDISVDSGIESSFESSSILECSLESDSCLETDPKDQFDSFSNIDGLVDSIFTFINDDENIDDKERMLESLEFSSYNSQLIFDGDTVSYINKNKSNTIISKNISDDNYLNKKESIQILNNHQPETLTSQTNPLEELSSTSQDDTMQYEHPEADEVANVEVLSGLCLWVVWAALGLLVAVACSWGLSGVMALLVLVLLDTPSPAPTEQEALEENHRTREEERIQKDRCLEVYPETLRQRQRTMIQSNNKVDIKNWSSSGGDLQQTSNKSNKKFLPSVKALRNQFESGKSNNNRADASPSPTNNSSSAPVLSRRSSTSTSSLASSSLEKASSTNSLNSQGGSTDNLLGPSIENGSPRENVNIPYDEEPVEPIFNQFKQVDEELRELMKRPPTTTGWNPRPLLRRLYYVPEAPKIQSKGTTYVNIEGYLEKLPSGRKKATFWNAWKRRYFVAKDGVLYYYQNNQSEKPSMKMSLMGGKVECMEPSMIGVDDGRGDKSGVMLGIDDGKGHYVVVRCSSRQEAERWRRALETHNVEDFASQYVQPWPIPTNPTLLRDTLVVDLGSASVRAGVLASNPTLPQLFFPSVVATERGGSREQIWGFDSLSPDIRAKSNITFPLRPSHKISKYSVDLSTVSSLLQKTFKELNVDPKNYHLQISVPRVLNTNTQAELLRILFEKFDVKSVNLTHQSILALYAYNATSGIVVDIGERMDIVPVIDGYIVDGGVSRVPYGGHRILDHLRQFLYQNNVSLVNEVESYIIRYILENSCYSAQHYNTEKARCTNNSENFEKNVSLSEFFQGQPCPYTNVNVDFGRFQATEGLFNPDAWGLDHPGLHKLVHKAIQECSMDIRKEMSRSIFLSGGVSQLPGLTERLTTELDNLTPPAIRPKVHASPYCYHAAYLGGCVLAESPAFVQSRITRQDWNSHGNMALRKWSL